MRMGSYPQTDTLPQHNPPSARDTREKPLSLSLTQVMSRKGHCIMHRAAVVIDLLSPPQYPTHPIYSWLLSRNTSCAPSATSAMQSLLLSSYPSHDTCLTCGGPSAFSHPCLTRSMTSSPTQARWHHHTPVSLVDCPPPLSGEQHWADGYAHDPRMHITFVTAALILAVAHASSTERMNLPTEASSTYPSCSSSSQGLTSRMERTV